MTATRDPMEPTSSTGGGPAAGRRIRRSAWLLGLLAMAFYVGFIVATAYRG